MQIEIGNDGLKRLVNVKKNRLRQRSPVTGPTMQNRSQLELGIKSV